MSHVIVELWPQPDAQKRALADAISAAASVLRPALSVAAAVATVIAEDHRPIDTAPAYLKQEQVDQRIRNSGRYIR
jgi:diketogulonate reductase-like aldo/keto reductase